MRRTLILTIAALAGLLLVWLVVVRVPLSDAPPTKPAKPIVQAPPPAQTVAPPPAASVASKPEEISVKPPVATTESKPPEQKPAEPPPQAAADDANATTDDSADESGDTESEDSGPPAIDTDHATDLLADMIARGYRDAFEASKRAGKPSQEATTSICRAVQKRLGRVNDHPRPIRQESSEARHPGRRAPRGVDSNT